MWISTLFSARQNPSNSSGANGVRQAHTFTKMFVWTCECERHGLYSRDDFAPLNLLLQRKINNYLEEPTRDRIQWHSVLLVSTKHSNHSVLSLSYESYNWKLHHWIMFVNVWVVFLLVIKPNYRVPRQYLTGLSVLGKEPFIAPLKTMHFDLLTSLTAEGRKKKNRGGSIKRYMTQ